MESQPQNPEFRINPENFHPRLYDMMHPISYFQKVIKEKKTRRISDHFVH